MLYSYARLQMLLLFINVPCFIAQYLVSFLVLQLFCEEKRAGCLTLFVFLVSRGCYCTVFLLAVPWVGLQCLLVVFPDHTHLLFF